MVSQSVPELLQKLKDVTSLIKERNRLLEIEEKQIQEDKKTLSKLESYALELRESLAELEAIGLIAWEPKV